MRFLQTYPLALTTLTPIHIGCGTDFEPTNYVIDDGVLFLFDLAATPLDADLRTKLLAAVGDGRADSILAIQRFFFEHRERLKGMSKYALAVSPGIEAQYRKRIGRVAQRERTGENVINRLEIERTVHHPHSGVPYIPGSALKGALRTAWLDQLNGGQPLQGGHTDEEASGDLARKLEKRARELEKELLGGAFCADPFRLVKISDASAEHVASKVLFSTNHKKKPSSTEDSRASLAVRREFIVGGQYRLFSSELRIESLPGADSYSDVPDTARRIRDFRAISAACNKFYQNRMDEDLGVLAERGLASAEWLSAFQSLLSNLRPVLKRGDAMLLRIGRHSGAESVTLDRVRRIRIKRGKGRPPRYSSEATTIWLAAEEEDARSGLVPFGWVLVELADAPEIPSLVGWCKAQAKPDVAAIEALLVHARQKAAVEAERLRQIAEEERRRAEEEARRKEEEARKFASLSEQGKLVELLRQKLERHAGPRQPVSGVLYGEVQKLLRQALSGNWSQTDLNALADVLEGLAIQKIDFGRKERDLRRTIRTLRGQA